MFVTRNKCHNDLAHVSKSTLIMCSAISLALVNSRTGSRIVVLSLQILFSASWHWKRLVLQNGMGMACKAIFTVLLLGTNIRSTTCDGVLSLTCGHKGIASKAMHATSMIRAITVVWCVFYAMHTTSMRAITVIWCSFVPYHTLLSDQTFH